MTSFQRKHIAVIGAGISGLVTAHILQKRSYKVTVYEKTDKIGGVWAVSHPGVTLQSIDNQYYITDFPWPKKPDFHPTGQQVLDYFHAAIKALNLDVRLNHFVRSMKEGNNNNGWEVEIEKRGAIEKKHFDFVIIAVGQYTDRKISLTFPGQTSFKGKVLTEVDVRDKSIFMNKKVVVLGFGRSALDMATFAVKQDAEVHHVFRTPHWVMMKKVLGIHFTRPLYARMSSSMVPSWAQPNSTQRFVHKHLTFLVNGFWQMISLIFRFQRNISAFGKGAEARKRIAKVSPKHPLLPDLRSALPLVPDDYYPYVASGKIEPHHAEIAGFTETGVTLSNGEIIDADIVVISVGSGPATFPFLPDKYRSMLEGEPDSVQLYRHLIHPRIPNLGFAGLNYSFFHMASVEICALWLSAVFSGEMELPSAEEMEAAIEHVRQWKRDNIHFETSRLMSVNARYQQYLDILLQDLGLSPYRKPNAIAEIFDRYRASDYATVMEEYELGLARRSSQNTVLHPIQAQT